MDVGCIQWGLAASSTGPVQGESLVSHYESLLPNNADFGRFIGKARFVFRWSFTGIILTCIRVNWDTQNWSRGYLKNDIFVGNLLEGYIRNVPLPRVPWDQSTFQSRMPTVHTIPGYYKDIHVIPTYNSTCRIGERVATPNSPQWQSLAINT